MLPAVLSLMVSFTPYRWPYIGPCVINRPVGYNSIGAAVSVNTGSRRAACGTMSVRAVRRMHTPAMRRTARGRRGALVAMVALGDMAVERDPDSARGKRSGASPVPHRG